MTRTALITGVSGQDGSYLAKALHAEGVHITGAFRPGTTDFKIEGSELFTGSGELHCVELDLTDPAAVASLVKAVHPDEVYHLAAVSSVTASWDEPFENAKINALGTVCLLDACVKNVPKARFVNASSSEIFALSEASVISENTAYAPASPYGAAKLHGHLFVQHMRSARSYHASNAILFNHESPLRPPTFVTAKIAETLARIAKGSRETLRLGNLHARRDWGHAQDYVDALIRMARAETAEDYIIATGQTLSVREFVDAVAGEFELKLVWSGDGLHECGKVANRVVVEVCPSLFRPVDPTQMRADPSKAHDRLGWIANRSGIDVAKDMARACLAD